MNSTAQAPGDRPAEALSLVVVTFNSSRVLPPLLSLLAAGEASDFKDIVFVDNASIDGTDALISASLSQARIVRNENNRGFAAAANQGVAETSGQIILLANPDVHWNPGAILSLRDFLASHPRAAAVCPRLVYPDGRLQSSVRRFPTHENIWLSRQSPLRAVRHFFPRRSQYTQSDPPVAAPIEAAAATCVLIRRDAYSAVGGMDEGYFLYVEDTDLCKRWHDAGWEVWMDPQVTVTHDWQGGSGKDPILRRYHRASQLRYFCTHHPDKPLWNLVFARLFGILDAWDRLRHGNPGASQS